MKPYRIHITPATGAAYSYTGLFRCSCDAICHALDLTQGHAARISAKVQACAVAQS